MTSSEIRQQFIDFFVRKHGHAFVPSSPVVPHDDPTLLFTNAGMNQFKPIFLGQETRAYTRAANTQKCIRAGGKHNDLDDVGRSRRHHTFFEMLGNWSFGDYFKRDAIAWSWELLTEVWKLDPTRLHVTVHAGDPAIGVGRDDEAARIWRDVAGLPADRIHYGSTKDNFWEMGETGPCGPCTEIFVDRTPDRTGGPSVLSGDDPRVMEIWNNVFIQYNRNADRSLATLPAQHVDTGMGLERIIQVLQGKDDNYGIDLFDPFWAKLTELSGIAYAGTYPKTNTADPAAEAADAQLRHDIAFRVIADHVRCLTFAITDGAAPSNDGRGYVLRRILRRAVRFGRQHLGLKDPFLHQMVPVVVSSMGDAFPELKQNPTRVVELVKDEEVSFGRTLDRGLIQFDLAVVSARATEEPRRPGEIAELTNTVRAIDAIKSVNEVGAGVIAASAAFKLHDTYGFPIDLTRIMAEERGMSVDIAGYEKLMEDARELARRGGKGEASSLTNIPPDALAELAKTGVKPTDDAPKFARGPVEAKVMAVWNGHSLGASPGAVGQDEPIAIILDRTNFYAEMGGQVGDAGLVASATMAFDVETTKAIGGYVLHVGRVRSGTLRVGDTVTATVAPARNLTQQNHTSTHLANWALREVLGDGVQQKGSLVDPDKLRFDFSHGKALAEDELTKIERLVCESIGKRLPVYAQEAPQEQALKINGLRAVFGEKYPPTVRVVSVGVPVDDLLKDPANPRWRQFSVEFCGGTHVGNAADAQSFAIVGEESVSKGVRRLVAVTGEAAKAANEAARNVADTIEQVEQLKDDQLAPAIAALQQAAAAAGLPLRARRRAQATVAELQQRQKALQKSAAKGGGGDVDVATVAAELLSQAGAIGDGGRLVVGAIPDASDDMLRGAIDSIRKKSPSYAILIGSAAGADKVTFIAAVSDDLIAKGLKSGDWVREVAKVTGGGGGGRPNMAQAGGKDPSKLDDALAAGKRFALTAVK